MAAVTGVTSSVQPVDDIGRVEPDEASDLEVGHALLGDEPADVPHGDPE